MAAAFIFIRDALDIRLIKIALSGKVYIGLIANSSLPDKPVYIFR